MQRPSIRDYETLVDYRRVYRDYAEHRHKTGDNTPAHYDEDYPLVRRCPRCDGVAVIELLSVTDDPMWRCKTNAYHDYADGFFDRDDFADEDE